MINGALLNVFASADAAVQQSVLGNLSVGAFAQALPEVEALEDSILRMEQGLEPRQGSLVLVGTELHSLRELIAGKVSQNATQNANGIRLGLLRLERFLERLPEEERSRLRTLAARTAIEMNGAYEGTDANVSANLAALKAVQSGIVVFDEANGKIHLQDQFSQITGRYNFEDTPNLVKEVAKKGVEEKSLTIWSEIREILKGRKLSLDLMAEAESSLANLISRKNVNILLFLITASASTHLEQPAFSAALIVGGLFAYLGGIANLNLYEKLRGDRALMRGNKLGGDATAEEYEKAALHYEKGGFLYLAAQAYYRAAATSNKERYWPLISGHLSAAGDYFFKRGLFAEAALAYLEGVRMLDNVQDEAGQPERINFRNIFLTEAAKALEKIKVLDPNSTLAKKIDGRWIRALRWSSLDHLKSISLKDIHNAIAANEISFAEELGENGQIEDAALLYVDASDHLRQAGEHKRAQAVREKAKSLATLRED